MKTVVVNRTVTVGGRKTSVQLEHAFWRGLKEIAAWRDMSLPDLIAAIDSEGHDGILARHSPVRAQLLSPPDACGGPSPALRRAAAEHRRVSFYDLPCLKSVMRETVVFVGDNPALLAWAVAMAIMSTACILCSIRARKASTSFALGRLERVELDRAVLLYRKVVDRLAEIEHETELAKGTLIARFAHRRRVRRKFSSELADLNAYAAHLRAAIVRLRRRPLQRYRAWLRLHSCVLRSAVRSSRIWSLSPCL